MDADDAGEVVLEAVRDGDGRWRATALRVSSCTRIALGEFVAERPPTVTALGDRAGLTRVLGGSLELVDTTSDRVLERVPTPAPTPTSGGLMKNGRSVRWYGPAEWCEALPGRTKNACEPEVVVDPAVDPARLRIDDPNAAGSARERAWTLPGTHRLEAVVRDTHLVVLAATGASELAPNEIVIARWPSGEIAARGRLDPPADADRKNEPANSPERRLGSLNPGG